MLKDRQINIKDGDLHATTHGEFHYVKNSTIYNSIAKSDNEAVSYKIGKFEHIQIQ